MKITDEQISQLGHRARQEADGVRRRLEQLSGTPITIAQFLGVEAVGHGINFAGYDKTLAECDAILKREPDAAFVFMGDQLSLFEARGELAGSLAEASAYRGKGGS